MGIERTDKWLDEYFNDPLRICRQMRSSFKDKGESELYRYLLTFGMYRPSRMTNEIFHELKKSDSWTKVEKLYAEYQKKWNGPDIPVYIFPFGKKRASKSEMKGGVSFKDAMILFLSHYNNEEKELEALFVHEYHHVCRLNESHKPLKDYTLIDSLVMEGFAEHAVTTYCGDSYNANWVSRYSDEELRHYWERDVKKHLQAKRTDPIHDAILFGKFRYPDLLGYSLGYWLIKKASQKKHFSIQDTFSVKSEKLMDYMIP
ncbi:DUF2268 domain-containing protein [Niallia oryzisoli]|uniref:DUF2268 domain-containing protein n=1 Tax=Niallia oryzisoli TaxID=1737571 RepID=UPI003735F256